MGDQGAFILAPLAHRLAETPPLRHTNSRGWDLLVGVTAC